MSGKDYDDVMPLFSKESLIVLEALSFTKTLYAFDFDGTLARIVRDPASARMTKVTEALLQELSEVAPVAIVSGRSQEDLKVRIPFLPRFLIGNHGLEGHKHSSSRLEKASKTCERWISQLNKIDFEPGSEIENKNYSIALHYRRARSKMRAKEQFKNIIICLDPEPRIIGGKCVINLVPEGAPHKGAAILDLIENSKLKHVLYVGDDDTDEDVFNLSYQSGQIMTVRVGQKKSSHAKYFIESQHEINKMLEYLIRFHKR